MDQKNLRGSLLLLLGAVIWGFAFVAQRVGMDSMEPISFNGFRTLLAGICLIPAVWVADKRNPRRVPGPEKRKSQRIAGMLCGVLLFVCTTLQQAGLVETEAGKAGFITALYVVLVPLAAWVFLKRNAGKWIWVSVALAVVGLFLLCVPAGESFSLSRGDLLILGCAISFTGEILVVDHYAPRVDPIRLSRDQFLVCGTLGTVLGALTETITWAGVRASLPALIYAGVFSGAIGYTIQNIAQRDTNPTVASLIMCLESVFGVIFGALVLGERMIPRETAGCVIMFTAVVLAQMSQQFHSGERSEGGAVTEDHATAVREPRTK